MLTSKERAELRSQATAIDTTLMVGKGGVTESVIAEADNQLTAREREVAKQAAFGLSNKDIAQRLNISVNTVKQSLRTAMDKTGALRRSDLADYI